MMNFYRSTNKYRSQKSEVDGIIFDSRKEARRYQDLKLLERAGEITRLELQKKYVLIPQQKSKSGKILERECSYIADFVYKTKEGAVIVEDAKGVRTKDYIIKRKLMLWLKGIRIQEV